MKKSIFTLCLFAVLFTSCKKDDDDPKTCEATQASIAGSYKLTSFKVNGIEAIDYFFESCQKDDVIVLNANGTYQYQDAGVACDPSGSESGDWSVTGNKLFIDYYGDEFTIESFDCTNLVGSGSFVDQPVSATFTKQ